MILVLRIGPQNSEPNAQLQGTFAKRGLPINQRSIAQEPRAAFSRPVHPSSFDKMADFVQTYLQPRRQEPLVILDLGSQDFNGSYRPLLDQPPWRYQGVDMAAGKNVDIVLRDPYRWREIRAGGADVIVSGQTFEHTEFFWLSMREMARALRVGGLLCLIAPSAGDEHRYPVDCWRVYPDGLRAMARSAGLETLEAWTQWEDRPQYDNESNKWHDSVLVARKPPETLRMRWQRKLARWLSRRAER